MVLREQRNNRTLDMVRHYEDQWKIGRLEMVRHDQLNGIIQHWKW